MTFLNWAIQSLMNSQRRPADIHYVAKLILHQAIELSSKLFPNLYSRLYYDLTKAADSSKNQFNDIPFYL